MKSTNYPMRLIVTPIFLLLGSLLVSGCGDGGSHQVASANDKVVLDTSFDEFRGWVDNSVGSLTQKQAYSGRYSLTVGGGREYSLTFKYPLGELTASKPRKLLIEAWVKTEQIATPARLVIEVGKPNTRDLTFWKPLPVFAVSEPNKWMKTETEMEMPADVVFDQTLHVYLWANGAATPVYLDNLRITNVD